VALKEGFDGEDLELREVVALKELGLVEAREGGFLFHGVGGLFERQEQPHGGLLALNDALKVADVAAPHVAALHLDDALVLINKDHLDRHCWEMSFEPFNVVD